MGSTRTVLVLGHTGQSFLEGGLQLLGVPGYQKHFRFMMLSLLALGGIPSPAF